MPEFYPGAFSFSPFVSDGPSVVRLDRQRHHGSDGRGEGQVYGYIQIPCKVELRFASAC